MNTLTAHVAGMAPTALDVVWTFDSGEPTAIHVVDLLYRRLLPDGRYEPVEGLTWVSFDRDVLVLEQGIATVGDDVDVDVPNFAFVSTVAPGGRVAGRMIVPLPARPNDPYHPPSERDPSSAETATQVTVLVGWVPVANIDAELLSVVGTTLGPRQLLRANHAVQRHARADLTISVLALPDRWLRPPPQRACQNCGLVNLGEQSACLRCGHPL